MQLKALPNRDGMDESTLFAEVKKISQIDA